MLTEFKKFALRGNVVDLAVGVVLGVAFNAVVQSVVDGVIMPAIAGVFGQPDFGALTVGLGEGVIRYGDVLTALMSFLLVALALFVVVQGMNRIAGKRDGEPRNRECPFCKTSIPLSATRCAACTSEVQPQAV